MKISSPAQPTEHDLWRAQMRKILLPQTKGVQTEQTKEVVPPAFTLDVSEEELKKSRADYLEKFSENLKKDATAEDKKIDSRFIDMGSTIIGMTDAESISWHIDYFLESKNVRYDVKDGTPFFDDFAVNGLGKELNHILDKYGKDSDFIFDLRDTLDQVAPQGVNPLLDFMRGMVRQISAGRLIQYQGDDFHANFRDAVLKTYAPQKILPQRKSGNAKNIVQANTKRFDSAHFAQDVDTRKAKQGLSILLDSLGKTEEDNVNDMTSASKNLSQAWGQDEIKSDNQKEAKQEKRTLLSGLDKAKDTKKTKFPNDKAEGSQDDKLKDDDKKTGKDGDEKSNTKDVYDSTDAVLQPHVHSVSADWDRLAKEFILRWPSTE